MSGLTEVQTLVLEVVKQRSKENPITGRDIARTIGLRDRVSGKEGADLRAIVNALRSKEYPICADGEGYYYARNNRELQEYIDSLRGRIDKEMRAVRGLEAAFRNIKCAGYVATTGGNCASCGRPEVDHYNRLF